MAARGKIALVIVGGQMGLKFNDQANSWQSAVTPEEMLGWLPSELADESSGDWFSARLRAHAGDTPGLHGPDDSWIRDWRSPDRRPQLTDSDRRWSSGRTR